MVVNLYLLPTILWGGSTTERIRTPGTNKDLPRYPIRIRTPGTNKDSNPRCHQGLEPFNPTNLFDCLNWWCQFLAFSDLHYLCKQKRSSFETKIEFMKILGNIIWLVFGGLGIAVEYFASSLLLMITIIGILYLLILLYGKRKNQELKKGEEIPLDSPPKLLSLCC